MNVIEILQLEKYNIYRDTVFKVYHKLILPSFYRFGKR